MLCVQSPEDTQVYHQCGTSEKSFLKKRNPIAHQRKVQSCLQGWKEMHQDQAASFASSKTRKVKEAPSQDREIHAKDKPYETFAVVYQVVQVPRREWGYGGLKYPPGCSSLQEAVLSRTSLWSWDLGDHSGLGMARVNTNVKVMQDPCWQPLSWGSENH